MPPLVRSLRGSLAAVSRGELLMWQGACDGLVTQSQLHANESPASTLTPSPPAKRLCDAIPTDRETDRHRAAALRFTLRTQPAR